MFDLTDKDVQTIITALRRSKNYFTDQKEVDNLIEYLEDGLEEFRGLEEADGKLSVWERNV